MTKGKKYKIKGSSRYFKDKYGTANPIIEIEGNWKEITGKSWMRPDGNPAAMFFSLRSAMDNIAANDTGVMYGKINNLGELVHISELEPIKTEIL